MRKLSCNLHSGPSCSSVARGAVWGLFYSVGCLTLTLCFFLECPKLLGYWVLFCGCDIWPPGTHPRPLCC